MMPETLRIEASRPPIVLQAARIQLVLYAQ
jgi:hypothetical protein